MLEKRARTREGDLGDSEGSHRSQHHPAHRQGWGGPPAGSQGEVAAHTDPGTEPAPTSKTKEHQNSESGGLAGKLLVLQWERICSRLKDALVLLKRS